MKISRYYLLALLLFLATPSALNASQADSKEAEPKAAPGLILTVDQYSDTVSSATLESWLIRQSSFYLSPNILSEFENTNYCPTHKIFCALTLTQAQKQHIRLSSRESVNLQATGAYLEDLARKVNRDPTDAKFKVINGAVETFEQSRDGIALDVPASIETLAKALKEKSGGPIALPYLIKKSNVNYADINNLGISALIGEGTSDFKGSTRSRIRNIEVATERYNGLLIKPGEEFSFVKNLGEVDAEHGYLPELVIKNNVTEPEFGGGICQVSSTAFRAAIYSGLKITMRRNHAYPVSYYNPQGMDATIYIPSPDLRFTNNTPNHILIQTNITGTVLTFAFYGTDDGRKTTVDGPRIIEKQPDGALKATFTQHVKDINGNEFISDVFNSSYASPYKYPHPGGPVLSAKPANWSEAEWKDYKKAAKAAAASPR